MAAQIEHDKRGLITGVLHFRDGGEDLFRQRAKNVVVAGYASERDQYGLPIPHVIFSYHENDKRLIAHAKRKMRDILEAAGGANVWMADRMAHLLGTCRMGNDPMNSVVNADCRSHDIPNLFVCDGSVFTTSTGVNPSLTIEAIAARTADRIEELKRHKAIP